MYHEHGALVAGSTQPAATCNADGDHQIPGIRIERQACQRLREQGQEMSYPGHGPIHDAFNAILSGPQRSK